MFLYSRKTWSSAIRSLPAPRMTAQKDYAWLLQVFVIQQMERMEIKAALQLVIKVIHSY